VQDARLGCLGVSTLSPLLDQDLLEQAGRRALLVVQRSVAVGVLRVHIRARGQQILDQPATRVFQLCARGGLCAQDRPVESGPHPRIDLGHVGRGDELVRRLTLLQERGGALLATRLLNRLDQCELGICLSRRRHVGPQAADADDGKAHERAREQAAFDDASVIHARTRHLAETHARV
jgi:hypothetical protein